MRDFSKYQGIFPALHACYDKDGQVSPEGVRATARYLLGKGVKGLYVGGSSGECIYQGVEERKLTLEHVMDEVGGKMTIIAHVACNNNADSCELAAHAEGLGVDAVAAIPPIYFHLPPKSIAKYWDSISDAAPNTDFIIYNIPQLAGVALTVPLMREMLKNPRVVGVKNSSMPVQNIQMWRDEGAIVFNGPDEQLLSGLAAGAIGGIGGTYAAMPELFLRIYQLYQEGNMHEGLLLQDQCCRIISKICSAEANMYAIIKEIVRIQGGPDMGGVRPPLLNMDEENDYKVAAEAAAMIAATIRKFC